MYKDFDALRCPVEAARRTALDFGISVLARKMGINERVLACQLNPEQEGHKLGLATAIAMTELMGNLSIIEAWAAQHGKILVDAPKATRSEEELFDDVLELNKHFGDFSKQLHEARKDGVIDPVEYQNLSKVLKKMQQHSATVDGSIKSQVRRIP